MEWRGVERRAEEKRGDGQAGWVRERRGDPADLASLEYEIAINDDLHAQLARDGGEEHIIAIGATKHGNLQQARLVLLVENFLLYGRWKHACDMLQIETMVDGEE